MYMKDDQENIIICSLFLIFTLLMFVITSNAYHINTILFRTYTHKLGSIEISPVS